jgi:hypothetical protein
MVRALSSGNLLLVLVGGETGDAGKYYYYSRPDPVTPTGRFGRRKSRDAIAQAEETTVG